MSRGPIKVCKAIPAAHYEIYEIININKKRQNLPCFHKFIVEQNEKVEDDDSHVIPVPGTSLSDYGVHTKFKIDYKSPCLKYLPHAISHDNYFIFVAISLKFISQDFVY